jgi:uncharacterized membrane protein YgdD (TMEM256/DUF423 family)
LRPKIHLIALIAALQGAGGVTLAAAAAHIAQSELLATASSFLMIHAAAGLALAALAAARATPEPGLIAAAFALQAGVTLFAIDLAARGLGFGKLFPYAAPLGGSLTILAWLALALWAGWRLVKTRAGGT